MQYREENVASPSFVRVLSQSGNGDEELEQSGVKVQAFAENAVQVQGGCHRSNIKLNRLRDYDDLNALDSKLLHSCSLSAFLKAIFSNVLGLFVEALLIYRLALI